ATAWMPRAGSAIVPGMLVLLTMSVGLPFFAVSTIAPLLQRWFALSGHKDAADPYFLYAASNMGSFVGLLAYPILIEPILRVAVQSRLWTAGYVLLILFVALCGSTIWRLQTAAGLAGDSTPAADAPDATAAVTLHDRLLWMLQSAVPASLMLSVTTYISTD